MAVTIPQVVTISNAGVRPAMDRFASAYYAAKQLLDAYDSGRIEAMLPDDPTFSNFIDDGSATDGRPQLSAGGLKAIIANTRALVQQLETKNPESGLSLIQGVLSVSPKFVNGA